MRQVAWLDFYRGKWRLVTGNPEEPNRKWEDKVAALSDLANEGWIISGPYPKRQKSNRDSRLRFLGFALKRMVH
jgi:hypothetical protein